MQEPIAEAAAGIPTLPLRSVIRRYRGYRTIGAAGAVHRGLPSGQLTFIISLHDPIDIVSMPGDLQPPGRFQAFVGGLHASAAYIHHEGLQHGVSVELTPFGARRLLGLPAAALAWAVVGLDELLPSAGGELVDRLLGSQNWGERFGVLDEILVRELKHTSGPPAEVAWTWEQLVSSAGGITVSALADEVGYSRRHLSELFRRELGLTPKVAARVLRFERSRRLVGQPNAPTLADAAMAAGYYDQAHMDREWSEIAGCSPTTWIAEEFPFVQDEPTEIGPS